MWLKIFCTQELFNILNLANYPELIFTITAVALAGLGCLMKFKQNIAPQKSTLYSIGDKKWNEL